VLVFRLVVVLLAIAALGLSARLLPLAWRGGSRLGPLAVRVGLSAVLLPMPAGYFGQREHLTLALVVPYLFAAAAGAGQQPSRGLRLTVASASALVRLAAFPGGLGRGHAVRWVRRAVAIAASADQLTIVVGARIHGVAVLIVARVPGHRVRSAARTSDSPPARCSLSSARDFPLSVLRRLRCTSVRAR
jgi:hypothetical protein